MSTTWTGTLKQKEREPMEHQLSLFDRPPILEPTNAPTTRAAAQTAIKPDAARLRGQVLAYIRSRGASGATDQEIQDALGMSGDTERPRRRELQTAGLIVDSGKTRSTPSGRAAVVWVAAASSQE